MQEQLPLEIYVEIFQYLSLKHLGKLMVINKTISQYLEQSLTFWNKIYEGYSRHVGGSRDFNQFNIQEQYPPGIYLLIGQLVCLKNWKIAKLEQQSKNQKQTLARFSILKRKNETKLLIMNQSIYTMNSMKHSVPFYDLERKNKELLMEIKNVEQQEEKTQKELQSFILD